MDNKVYIDQLKSCELFKDLSDLELNELYSSMTGVKIQTNEVLMTQGEISDCMYVLLSGRLIVIGTEGNVIAQIGRGETVGEMGIITNDPRSVTVVAMRESFLLKLDQAHFNALWNKHPSLLFEITKIITQRLRRTLKPRQKYSNDSHTVLLKANQNVDMPRFLSELSSSFEPRFRYKILKRSDFPEVLTESEFDDKIRRLEIDNNYLFYEVGTILDQWGELCMAFADRILVLANGSEAASYDPAIYKKLTSKALHEQIKKNLILLYEASESPHHTTSWLEPISFHRYYHVRYNREKDFERLLRFLNGTAIGIVFGGGGTRSFTQVGIMKYVYEQGIPIDAFAGTSAGALNAASYDFSRDYKDYLEMAFQVSKQVSFREYTIPFGSILSSRSITGYLKKMFGETKIEDLERPFLCVAADLINYKQVVFDRGLLWLALRSTMSIPGIYPPVFNPENQHLLVDGAVINNVPVDVMKDYLDNLGKIISVDVSQPYAIAKNYNYPLELTWTTILKKKIFSWTDPLIIPSITGTFFQGLLLASAQKTKMNIALSTVNIVPPIEGASLLDPSKFQELVDIGYNAAKKSLSNWKTQLDCL